MRPALLWMFLWGCSKMRSTLKSMSSADCLPQCGWALSNQLKAQMPQKTRNKNELCSRCLLNPNHNKGLAPSFQSADLPYGCRTFPSITVNYFVNMPLRSTLCPSPTLPDVLHTHHLIQSSYWETVRPILKMKSSYLKSDVHYPRSCWINGTIAWWICQELILFKWVNEGKKEWLQGQQQQITRFRVTNLKLHFADGQRKFSTPSVLK